MAEYRTRIEIAAGVEAVFDHLVTEQGLTAWMGQRASLRPERGGRFHVDIAGQAVRGEYLVVDRPHRVVVSWGVLGSTDLPPGVSTVSFELTPTPNGTRVDLVHSGLPDTHLDGHRDGWTHFLPRLSLASTGHDPGTDHWDPLHHRTEGTSP